ncbi:MAG: M20/M25/M40 family metallo-hydrolase [Gemmatimonadetes bacterium]|nr:M20/M25/M40 family metallo-hydrolase [Gemmatimonadota bacterium]
MRFVRSFSFTAAVALFLCSSLGAQEKADWEAVSKIREEGLQRSQVMDIVGYMADVLGPRLTASPRMREAQEWAQQKMAEIGLENVVVERAGEHGVNWDNEYVSLHMIEPDYQPIIGYAKAFTASTDGKIVADAVIVDVQSEEDFAQYRGELAGKVVLIAPPLYTEPHFTPDAIRHTEESLEALSRTTVGGEQGGQTVTVTMQQLAAMRSGGADAEAVSRPDLDAFLRDEGGALVVDIGSGRGDDGVLLVGSRHDSRGDRSYEGVMNSLPEVDIATEHYNRMYRILERGIPVTMEAEVRNRIENSDPFFYNVVGEIPGTDLADEIVIVGGHYDSWHGGTGAVDNASGCAVALEAARILKAIGVQPRRTIRVAFWSYEEGGLNGSREYVNAHFGNPRDGTKPDYDRFSGYFNMDNGTGQFRGVYLQENLLVKPIFEAWMKPLNDLGVQTLAPGNTSGTDHLSFDRAGLNGWQFIQDRIDYRPRRHHTNMDVVDGLVPEDMMVNAVVMATFAYHAAMRDELLPRKAPLTSWR